MLPRLPLDDRSFADLVQEMRQGIPHRLPEWTDENTHDPGITFLELFAWLSEMQQFYLSRIPERNMLKFMQLLGIARQESQSAKTEAVISQVTSPVRLPRGTKLQAEDQIFETTEAVHLLPMSIDRIITRTEREASDRTASNESGNSAFYAFGLDARSGSVLYMSLDQAPAAGESITLSVQHMDEAAYVSPTDRAGVVPSARVSWKAYCFDEATGGSWMPARLLADETLHLTYSGRVMIAIDGPMRPVVVHPAADKPRYWLSCTLEEAGYERPPRIDRLLLNTVKVKQQDTQVEKMEYDCPGTPDFAVVAEGYLAQYGKLRVQVRQADGRWRDWRVTDDLGSAGPDDRWYRVDRRTEPNAEDSVKIRFGDGVHGAMPPEGTANIRLIHYEEAFEPNLAIGRSNGLPGQKFELPDIPCRQSDGLLIQVGVPDADTDEMLWEDWKPVADFDRSGPLDRHYIYRPDLHAILFGNDEHGEIPHAGSRSEVANLIIVSCALGGGERGNIKPGLLTHWVEPQQRALGLMVTNTGYASGGTEAESIQDCLQRTESEWGKPYCAVNNEDYETIAGSTPGLQVSRVHVLPGYAPGREEAPAAVTVVVVPEGASRTPMPSPGFLATVAKHLDERRLITTDVHVIAPTYVQVTVQATIVVEPHFMEEAHRIVRVLGRLLSPLDRPSEGIRGWPFGRTVTKGDIYGAIAGIKGVAFVQDLWLDAEGAGARKTASGDILLPPSGLVYSGDHHIELISRAQL